MLLITKDRVKQILAQYRKKVKISHDKDRRKTKGIRTSSEVYRPEAIKEYWKHPVIRSIMIKNIKICVWSSNRPKRAPYDLTISRILRKEWNMRYKILQKWNPITKKANNISISWIFCYPGVFESNELWTHILMNLAIHKKKIWRGWSFKGSYEYFIDDVESISFSVIWVFLEHIFYGLIINPNANDKQTFYHFLLKLMDVRKKEIRSRDMRISIILDNASIHKSKNIQKFALKNKISILAIPPYWPVLNAAEKLILNINKKVLNIMKKEGNELIHVILLYLEGQHSV